MSALDTKPSTSEIPSRSPARRILLSGLGLGLALVLGSPIAAQTPIKIAVVDLDRVIVESPAGKALQQELAQLQNQAQTRLDNTRRSVADLKQRAATEVDPDILRQLQNQLEDANLSARRIQDEAQRAANKLQEQKLLEIRTALQPVFDRLRDDEGYDLILNNTPGVVVMSGPRVDITQQVLAGLIAASSGD